VPGLDARSRELLLIIPASEAATNIPGFQPRDGEYVDDLLLRLVVLNDEEQQRYLDPNQFADIWSSEGSHKDRIVEQEFNKHLFRVYRRVEYPKSWNVFTINPETAKIPADVFSFWLGHCLSSRSPLTPSAFWRFVKAIFP
jgi:hypothetical protein